MEHKLISATDYISTTETNDADYMYVGGRLKKKRRLRKELREQGLSRKDARKTAKETLKSGIQAITIAPKGTTTDEGYEDEFYEDGMEEGFGDPSFKMEDGTGGGALEGGTDWTTYLIYGGVGVAVLMVVGAIAFSGGGKTKAASPVKA